MTGPSAEELFERHHLRVFRFLRRMLGDAAGAEDLTQEVLVRVLSRIEAYEPREREAAWVFRIARRLVIDLRRAKSRAPATIHLEETDVVKPGPEPLLAASLEQALGSLSAEDREVFLLREEEGFGYQEIAAIMDLTPDAVRNRIHRARCALRLALQPELQLVRHRVSKEVPR